MNPLPPDSPDAMARVLAMFAVADRQLNPEEIETLEQLDAFARIGVTRERFLLVAGGFSMSLGGPHGWMRLSDLQLVDRLLAEVREPGNRITVARLAAAVITANGRVDETERIVFDQMLNRWGLTRNRIALAIREDRATA